MEYKTKWHFLENKDKYNFENIKKEFEIIKNECESFRKKWKNKNNYKTDPKVLAELLTEYDLLHDKAIDSGYGILYYYSQLAREIDISDEKLETICNSFQSEVINNINLLEFVNINISKIKPKLWKIFLESKELANYKNYIRKLFISSEHILDEKSENIINRYYTASHSRWLSLLDKLLYSSKYKIKENEYNLVELLKQCSDPQKEIRINASEGVNKILKDYSEVSLYELNSILDVSSVDYSLRKFKGVLDRRCIRDDIHSFFIKELEDSVTKYNEVSHRFYKLKAKILGCESINYYERSVSIGDIDMEFSVFEACNIIRKVFGDLDSDFELIFTDALNKARIDFFPQKGKTGGAFCSMGNKNTGSYILLNYQSRIDDIKTLAHELGHYINNVYMSKHQNNLNMSLSMSIAETASTFFEDFVMTYMEKTLEPKYQLFLLMERLNDQISTIFRQIACLKLEKDLHIKYYQNKWLSIKEINEMFITRMKEYMGSFVKFPKGSELWWIYWSHLRYDFYVYSYASGLLVSKVLQNMVKQDHKSIEKVKTLFSYGSSISPEEQLKSIGLDVIDSQKTIWETGLTEVQEMMTKAEKLYSDTMF